MVLLFIILCSIRVLDALNFFAISVHNLLINRPMRTNASARDWRSDPERRGYTSRCTISYHLLIYYNNCVSIVGHWCVWYKHRLLKQPHLDFEALARWLLYAVQYLKEVYQFIISTRLLENDSLTSMECQKKGSLFPKGIEARVKLYNIIHTILYLWIFVIMSSSGAKCPLDARVSDSKNCYLSRLVLQQEINLRINFI